MSMLMRLAATSGGPKTYVDDVFSTWLYTGNGSTQTITTGIDTLTNGGTIWFKGRAPLAGGTDHQIIVPDANPNNDLFLSTTSNAGTSGTTNLSRTTTGFTLNSAGTVNYNTQIYAAWSFKKAAKFFDVVTYTGNGSNRAINHSLGQVPGMILVKRRDTNGDWQVYHRSLANTDYAVLNSAAAIATSATRWNSTTATATQFTVGTDATVNANSGTYVAYLFSHDTASDGLIQCGTYAGNGLAAGPTVTLNWEPQFVMIKRATGGSGGWNIFDNMRGITVGGNDWYLQADSTNPEAGADLLTPSATGFQITSSNAEVNNGTATYIYVAIRRSNKPPTAGTQVFQPTVYTGTNVDNRLVDTTIAPDMVWARQRDDTVLAGLVVGDRLRGQPYLRTGTTAAETNDADAFDQQLVSAVEYGTAFSAMNGFFCGNDATAKLNANTTASNHVALAFKRARGFFDVVCYTGSGGATNVVNHSLGVAPEFVIIKNTDGASGNGWLTYVETLVNTPRLNTNGGATSGSACSAVSATTITVTETTLNAAHVAYLFASLPGICKVGRYTGNGGTAGTDGTSQTINCGFTAGARFVLIKRRDSTGDWYVFDSARGIVAGNDPYLRTNSTGAEVTTVDAVDADNGGFIVNQTSGTDLNVTSATYLYLAIA